MLIDRVEKKLSSDQIDKALSDIVDLERGLADDGMIIIKFCLHISKKEQKTRLDKLLKQNNVRRHNQALEQRRHKTYEKYVHAAEEMLEHTEAEWAPWHIVGATDSRYTRLAVMRTIIESLEDALVSRGHEVRKLRDIEENGDDASAKKKPEK